LGLGLLHGIGAKNSSNFKRKPTRLPACRQTGADRQI